MLLSRKLDPGMLKSVEILATGTSRYDVDKARYATYPASSISDLGREKTAKLFEDVEGGKQVVPSIRKMVTFGILDLVNGIFPSMLNGTSGLNLIVLRNILTFYNWKISERIISKFHECLYEDGILILGRGERLPDMAGWEVFEEDGNRMYRKKESDHSAGIHVGSETLKSLDHSGLRGTGTVRKSGERNLYIERAQEYLSSGETRKALITLTEAIASGADDASVYLRLADLYASRNDVEHAEEQCRKAIEIDAEFADAHVLLGVIQLRKGQYKESMDSLRKALFIQPNNHEVKLHIARVLDGMGKRTAARKVYTRIVNEGRDSSNQLILDVAKKALEEVSVN
jgi:Tfp pilus assembly protein PilF